MAFTQDDFQTYLTACNTAIDSDDYVSARKAALQAQVVLAGMPDYMDGDRSIKNKELLDNVMEMIDTMESNSSGAKTNSRVVAVYRRD